MEIGQVAEMFLTSFSPPSPLLSSFDDIKVWSEQDVQLQKRCFSQGSRMKHILVSFLSASEDHYI
jgi:hypothetical protein